MKSARIRADLTRFILGMVDSLNAEVSLGTIANVQEAIQWLGYTYLFGKASLNPIIQPLITFFSPHAEGAFHLR